MTAAPSFERSRFGIFLVVGQVRYQVLLLLRSPIGVFTALVIPLMLLVALDLATPQATFRLLHGVRYADFITPAMGVFALLNACYVNVITSIVVAREEGVLKRLHGTPLPLWAYVIGRVAAAAVVAIASMAAVFAVGVVFYDVTLTAARLESLAGVTALGIVTFTTLGMAVSSLVPHPDTALPVAYGTVLPLAFLSDLFFPSTDAPTWLQRVAADFPLAPIARSAERIFRPGSSGWPMTRSELVVVLVWLAGSALVTALGFRWEPGASLVGRARRSARRG